MTTYDLLQKPLWSLKDIQTYFNCSISQATKVMQQAKKLGVSRVFPSKAKRDYIFEVSNLNFKEELEKQKLLRGQEHGKD